MTDPALPPIALVLSGGNALGAFQAGAYQAIHERGLLPGRVVGASIGAVNGAIIAGNAPEDRLDRLRAFWRPSPFQASWWEADDTWRRSAAAAWAMLAGQPDAFSPKLLPLPDPAPSLYDTRPLERRVAELTDFDRLNRGEVRYAATAIDLDSGEDVVMDAAATRITSAHVRASGALLPVFPPVEIDGRALVDPGLSANLPLDVALGEAGPEGLLVLAVDLLPMASPRPQTLGEVTARMQDIVFAAQSRRALETWQRIFALRHRVEGDAAPRATVLHVAYADQTREVVGKAFDFSPESVRQRWEGGRAAMARALDRLLGGEVRTDGPGLTWIRAETAG
jgi:NTE family protein